MPNSTFSPFVCSEYIKNNQILEILMLDKCVSFRLFTYYIARSVNIQAARFYYNQLKNETPYNFVTSLSSCSHVTSNVRSVNNMTRNTTEVC